MIAFICLFVPSVISIWIYEALSKHKLNLKEWIYRYSLNVLCINLLVFLVKKFILATSAQGLSNMSPEAAIRYMVIAVPLAIIFSVFQIFVSKNVRVRVCEEENEQEQ